MYVPAVAAAAIQKSEVFELFNKYISNAKVFDFVMNTC